MSTKPNPTVIGSFALGAIALAIFAVVVFGSGDLFAHHPRAVTFFTGNMQGLESAQRLISAACKSGR